MELEGSNRIFELTNLTQDYNADCLSNLWRVSGGLYLPPPPPYFWPYSVLQTLKDVLQKILICPPPSPSQQNLVFRPLDRFSAVFGPPGPTPPDTLFMIRTRIT